MAAHPAPISETGRIVVEARDLARVMKNAAAIVKGVEVMPILANAMLKAGAGNLEIVTSNLDIEYRQHIPLVSGEALATTVDARKLERLAAAAESGAQISLGLEKRLTVKSGRSQWILPVLPVTDFPAMPFDDKPGPCALDGAELARALARTLWSASTEPTRYCLGGVYLDQQDGHLRLTCTNGHTIASVTTETPWPADAKPVIVPTKFAQTIERIAAETKEIVMGWDERKLRVIAGHVTLTGKLVDGLFPDYRRVIPPMQERPLVIEPDALRKALRRVELVSNQKTRGVAFEPMDNAVNLSMHDDEGDASEQVQATGMAAAKTGFNASYLANALEAIGGDTVEIHQHEAGGVALLRRSVPDGAIVGIMPMRV